MLVLDLLFFFLSLYFVILHDTACLHLAEERTRRRRHALPVGFLPRLNRRWPAKDADTSGRCTPRHNDGYGRGDTVELLTRPRLQRNTGQNPIYVHCAPDVRWPIRKQILQYRYTSAQVLSLTPYIEH